MNLLNDEIASRGESCALRIAFAFSILMHFVPILRSTKTFTLRKRDAQPNRQRDCCNSNRPDNAKSGDEVRKRAALR